MIDEIEQAAEWIVNGTTFPPDAILDDGTVPYDLIDRWQPWVSECATFFVDGMSGELKPYKYSTILGEAPWIDIQVYRVIHKIVCEHHNNNS